MNETAALCLRILSTALFDWGLAYACGLLLASRWLRRRSQSPAAVRVPSLVAAAALMVVALSSQFYLLAATMTDEVGLLAVARSASAVASTHAGAVTLWALGVACLLLLVSVLRLRPMAVTALPVGLIAVILLLHSAMGHAARDGSFSRAELLQFLHLAGMAVWTGGVIVSGLVIAPRLAAATGAIDPAYLKSLSSVSAYSLAVVLLIGALKGWSGLEGQLGGLLHTAWGRILMVKLFFVAIAMALGLLHRVSIDARPERRSMTGARRLLITLRLEAVCLTLVVLLSAWLAGVDPAAP